MNEASRYELLHHDSRYGLARGDILICSRMDGERIVVDRRERDGYEPDCSEAQDSLLYVSGPRLYTAP